MKKHRKTLIIFLCGLLLGVLLMGGGMWLFGRKKSQKAEKKPVEQVGKVEEPNMEEGTEEDTEEAEESTEASADTWDSGAVYVGGDEVAYQGKVYRAKWWTQNEEPGTADVWEDLMIAAGETMDQIEEQLPVRTDVEKREDFKVVGYFPSWKQNIETIQYDVLTHINYAFAIPTEEGKLRPLENAPTAKKIIKEAHKHNVKVFLAIGGWSYNDVPLESTFMAATESKVKRERLVKEIISMCDQYGFDGVDLDWEHPRVDGNSSRQYEALIVDLAKALHKEDKELSSAVLSGVTADGNIYYDSAAHTDKVLKTVDWINVMAYDGGDGERHSAYDFAVNCGKYWTKTRKMPAGKVVLGVPFYARPSWAAYSDILATEPDAWKHDRVDYNGMEVWYNGEKTIEKKTKYALDYLGGVMIWEISQDTTNKHSLQTAIGKNVRTCQQR